jgi:hypothetical protein
LRLFKFKTAIVALSFDYREWQLTSSQPLDWEIIFGGSASSGLMRGIASGNTFPSLLAGNKGIISCPVDYL